MSKTALIWAAVFGLTGVVLGALAAHALPQVLEAKQVKSFETAVYFQLFHAMALMGTASLSAQFPNKNWKWVVWGFVGGTILFSWSIFLLSTRAVTGLESIGFLGPITPIGGVVLMAAWGLLLVLAVRMKDKD